jgi:hypothetical protein
MSALKLAAGTPATLVAAGSAPGNAAVAAGARSDAGDVWDNSLSLEPECHIEFVGTFSVAPAVGRRILLYALVALDGTTYPAGSSSVLPSQTHVVAWGYVQNATANRIRLQGPGGPGAPLRLPPSKLKVILGNDTDQQLGTGWSVIAYPVHPASS